MRCISIEVTDTFTYVAEVDYQSKKPRLYNCVTLLTPEGVFDDGYIREPEAFAKFLLPEFTRANMRSRHVVFSISSSRIANRDVVIPEVKPNKIMQLLTANASDYFPVDVSTYRLGYNILTSDGSEEQKGMKLLVLAVPNDLLKTYYRLADCLNLKLQAMDYIGNALVGMFSPVLSDAPSLSIKIDDSSSVITIFKNKKSVLQRSIGYGVLDAMTTLCEEMDIDMDEAVERLRRYDHFNPGAEPDLGEDIEMLANGIARVVDYYNSRNEEKLSHIYMTGFAADFAGLGEYISETTGLEVSVITDFFGLVPTDHASIGNYVAAIGASLNPIDLMLVEASGKKKSGTAAKAMRREMVFLVLAGACLITAVSLTALTLLNTHLQLKESRELTEERDELLPVLNAYNDYQYTTGLYGEVTRMYDMTKNRNEELHAFVEELEKIMPVNAYISSFSSTGDGVSLSFTCSSKEEAGNFIEKLRELRSIMHVDVSGISESRDEMSGVGTVEFSASLSYRPVGDQPLMEEGDQ